MNKVSIIIIIIVIVKHLQLYDIIIIIKHLQLYDTVYQQFSSNTQKP